MEKADQILPEPAISQTVTAAVQHFEQHIEARFHTFHEKRRLSEHARAQLNTQIHSDVFKTISTSQTDKK